MIAYITPDTIHLAHVLGDQTTLFNRIATPAGMLSDPRFLLQATAFRVGSLGRATVVLDKPLDWSQAEEAGWQLQGAVTHWRAYRKEKTTIHIVTMSDRDEYANDAATADIIEGLDEPGLHVWRRLAQWEQLTGTQYYATPGVSAVMNLRNGYDGAQPVWRIMDQTGRAWEPPTRSIEAINFKSKRFTPKGGPWWRWDMRAAYLAAMAAVSLPFKSLKPTGTEPTTLDCGYYRVRIPAGLPGWMVPNHDRQGATWVTQATLGLLREGTLMVEILDSWTPRRDDLVSGHRRILRHWAEDWRDLSPSLMPGAYKQAYAQLVGLMNVPSGQIYRPDWRHMIIDQVRASMLRRILRVHEELSIWPVRVETDSVYYGVGPHQLNSLLGVGDRIGNMRHEGLVEP